MSAQVFYNQFRERDRKTTLTPWTMIVRRSGMVFHTHYPTEKEARAAMRAERSAK